LGRTPSDGQNTPLFLRLFPPPTLPPKTDESQYDSSKDLNDSSYNVNRGLGNSLLKKGTVPNFQKLIPRSFSSVSANPTWSSGLNGHDSAADALSVGGVSGFGGGTKGSFQSQISTYSAFNDTVNETRYLFFKFGTSFAGQPTHLKPKSSETSKQIDHKMEIPFDYLMKLLSLSKQLLNKEILQTLDEIAFSVFTVSFIVIIV
jgi:hypothetical protein